MLISKDFMNQTKHKANNEQTNIKHREIFVEYSEEYSTEECLLLSSCQPTWEWDERVRSFMKRQKYKKTWIRRKDSFSLMKLRSLCLRGRMLKSYCFSDAYSMSENAETIEKNILSECLILSN